MEKGSILSIQYTTAIPTSLTFMDTVLSKFAKDNYASH